MNCPKCKKPMRKVRWEITNNFRTDPDFKEYDKFTYHCSADDIWINIETPLKDSSDKDINSSES